jgi:hypothetical protein
MKILNYSPVTYKQSNQKIISSDVYTKLMHHRFSQDYFLYDRTQSIPHFLDVDESYSPIPTPNNSNLDFYTITKNRCLELLAHNKPINVCWSGGLDSTYVLLSLYHYANDKDQIRLYATYNSIIESGDLFDRYIKNKVKYTFRVNTPAAYNFITPHDEIFVTGAMSNQLFIPGLSYNKNRDNILCFKDNFNIVNSADLDYKSVLTEECIEFLYPSIVNSFKSINTLQELRWYINFNFTWYNVLTTSLINLDKVRCDKIHAFFNSNDFQNWSMTNKDPVTKTGDYSDERWQIREMITEYIGNSNYSISKKKQTSVLSKLPHTWLYLLNDYTNIHI